MIDTPPEPPPAQEQVIAQKLIDCGLKAEGFTVRYEEELQSIEVVISANAGASPDRFACINAATFPEIVTFADRAMFEEYAAFAKQLYRPQIRARLEAELKELGLWEGFPERGADTSLADYVRALEAHAGFVPGTMVRVEGETQVTFDPPPEGVTTLSHSEHLGPLLAVFLFASAREDFDFGFIGNGKMRD